MTICSCAIPIRRAWAMPSADTFSIGPIAELLDRWLEGRAVVVDPFARNSKRGTITNDLNPATSAQRHVDCLDFAQQLDCRADAVLLDPPYSYRQVVEIYQGIGREWTQQDQQQVGRWAKLKDALADVLLPGGVIISFGWNSAGFGKARGFELRELLLVAHGSAHNDTIVTVEEKLPNLFDGGAP